MVELDWSFYTSLDIGQRAYREKSSTMNGVEQTLLHRESIQKPAKSSLIGSYGESDSSPLMLSISSNLGVKVLLKANFSKNLT